MNVTEAFFKERNCMLPAENVCQLFATDLTEKFCIPQWFTFFHRSRQGGCFCPIAIQRFAVVFDVPARLIFFRPEAKIQRVEHQQPVDCTLCPIIKMIPIIPCIGIEIETFPNLSYPSLS